MDLLRGFTAVLLIIVHTGLYLGNDIGKGLWTFCDIIGSEPVAPVFMVLMGISIVYSHHHCRIDLLKRGIRLLAVGYMLNSFRSLLPFIILGNVDDWASIRSFFVVDILQFAGLSLILIALFKKLRLPNIAIFAVSICMVVLDQFIMLPANIPWDSELLTGIVNLFCPVSDMSCFPLLTWFVFPAFGLVFGDMLTHCRCKNKLYAILLPVGLCGTAYIYYSFYSLYPDYTRYYRGNNFYYMGIANIIPALLLICFVMSLWFFAGKILPGAIRKFLCFLSKNLNVYYIISWLLISMLIHIQAVCGWRFGTWLTIGIMALLIIACVWLTKLWLSVKAKIKKRKAIVRE